MLSYQSFDLPRCQDPGPNTNQGRIEQQPRVAQLPNPNGPGPHQQKPVFHRGHRHTQSQPCWPSAPRHASSRSQSWVEMQAYAGNSFPLQPNAQVAPICRQATIDEELDHFLADMSRNGSTSSSIISTSIATSSERPDGLVVPDVNMDQRQGRMRDRGGQPRTPATSPSKRMARKRGSLQLSRTAQSSPTRRIQKSPAKVNHASAVMKRGSSSQDSYQLPRQWSGSPIGSPIQTVAPIPLKPFNLASFEPAPFLDFQDLKDFDFSAADTAYNPSNYSPVGDGTFGNAPSLPSSPEISHRDLFPDLVGSVVQFPLPVQEQVHQSPLLLPHVGRLQALESLQAPFGVESATTSFEDEYVSSPQSGIELLFDAADGAIKETGVTAEQIAAHIRNPDPSDRENSLYSCTYQGCGRKFGRKENIRSHVQTHLGDRQFQCNHCGNDFVRQHDLKRHLQTHSGVKPHTCLCGQRFARQDALTRHHMRELPGCDGKPVDPLSPRKESKRGRPRKNRPDMEHRVEKAGKSRRRAAGREASPEELNMTNHSENKSDFGFMVSSEANGDPFASLLIHTTTSEASGSNHSGTPPELERSPSSPALSEFLDLEGGSNQLGQEDWELPSMVNGMDVLLYSFENEAFPTESQPLVDLDTPLWSDNFQ